MRSPIPGKHLPTVKSVDMRTGKETDTGSRMMMMPAKEGTCEWCAVEHLPEMPHNAQSMFYQYRFYNEHGRWPNWKDAMSHCDDKMRSTWTEHLEAMGVNVAAGDVNPRSGSHEEESE